MAKFDIFVLMERNWPREIAFLEWTITAVVNPKASITSARSNSF
jgi:hypothetical protein